MSPDATGSTKFLALRYLYGPSLLAKSPNRIGKKCLLFFLYFFLRLSLILLSSLSLLPLPHLIVLHIHATTLQPTLLHNLTSMSQTWLRGPLCGVDNCRSRLYRLSAGRKFCQFGHVMEGNFEFDDDDGDQYLQTRRLNILLTDTGFGASTARAADRSQSTQAARRLYGRLGKIHLLRCLQYVLKRVTPKVVVLLYPDHKGVTADKFTLDVLNATKLFWARCVNKSLDGRTLRLADLYALIYLAIRLLQTYPVYVEDMLALLLQNKVPYISALKMLPPHLLLLLSPATVSQLTNSAMPVNDAFYNSLGKLALMVAPAHFWYTPVEIFYPNAFRVFSDLHLDAPTLIVVFHRIVSRVHAKLLDVVLKSSGPLGFPDGRYLGILFLTIKLYFVGSLEVVDTDLWVPWLQSLGAPLPCFEDKHHHMDMTQLLDLSDEQTDQYCNWVYENLLEGKHDSDLDSVSTMQSRLYKIFTYDRSTSTNKESTEIPYERPKNRSSVQPPFALVRNELDSQQVSKVELELTRYFCVRYGIKEKSMDALKQLAEHQLYGLLVDEKLLRE